MEFWNDEATNESWRVLLGLAKKFKLVIIGGWACYLHTKAIKSRDVDIIVDFDGQKMDEEDKLTNIIRTKKAGDQVKVRVFRNKRTLDLTVTLGEAPNK